MTKGIGPLLSTTADSEFWRIQSEQVWSRRFRWAADAPESCSFRTLGSIDALLLSRLRTAKLAEIARIGAPHLKVFRP